MTNNAELVKGKWVNRVSLDQSNEEQVFFQNLVVTAGSSVETPLLTFEGTRVGIALAWGKSISHTYDIRWRVLDSNGIPRNAGVESLVTKTDFGSNTTTPIKTKRAVVTVKNNDAVDQSINALVITDFIA
jgi:hypothetical protein